MPYLHLLRVAVDQAQMQFAQASRRLFWVLGLRRDEELLSMALAVTDRNGGNYFSGKRSALDSPRGNT